MNTLPVHMASLLGRKKNSQIYVSLELKEKELKFQDSIRKQCKVTSKGTQKCLRGGGDFILLSRASKSWPVCQEWALDRRN